MYESVKIDQRKKLIRTQNYNCTFLQSLKYYLLSARGKAQEKRQKPEKASQSQKIRFLIFRVTLHPVK